MSRVIAYDIMRLFIGSSFLTPRGIDRVDLALARQIFSNDATLHVGVLPTPIGVCACSGAQVRRLLAYLQKLWAEDDDSDDALRWLIDRITRPEAAAQMPEPSLRSIVPRLAGKTRRMLKMLAATRFFPAGAAARVVPANAVYLNVGQLGLAMPGFFDWLEKRPDVTCAMMLHDTIPIDFPHLVGPKAPFYHERMIRTAARRGDRLIFNSDYTRDSVTAFIRKWDPNRGRDNIPSLVRALPLPPAFINIRHSIPELAKKRYFLAVSTVEPRKNHDLLFRVWRRLIATMGADAPHLVIVGSPGYDAANILAPLAGELGAARRVHHVVGLSSPALAALTLGAAGMLCPTLAEGFGLPLLEAKAMGVPSVVSDIPAHRELADARTVLLPPDDEEGWARTIIALPGVAVRQRPIIPFSMTEVAYCADLVDFACRTRN